MNRIIGIDLGTTNSAVASMKQGSPEIIENAEGARTTPSVVAVSKKGERLVGVSAKRQTVTNPTNTVYGIKRFMGHMFTDKEVQEDKDNVPFSVSKAVDGGVEVELDRKYRPEEISAMILRKLKEDAEARLGGTVSEAVITVPAYFNDTQRKATKDAGKIAGLDVKRIINEPTAAALAYGFGKKGSGHSEKIAVFDFGGGTFDVSVLDVGDDVVEVKSTGGDSHLGGRDIDRKLIQYVIEEFKKNNGIDLSKDTLAVQRLDEEIEKAKIELSSKTETEINIPYITSTSEGPKHLLINLPRTKLESVAKPYIDRAIKITKEVMEKCDCTVDDLKEIILVGGQTRMPAMQLAVKEFFGKDPNKTINPDEVVALGAAIQAGILSGDISDVLLLDVTPLSLGIETLGGVSTKIIEANTTLPTSASQVFSTASDNQPSVEIHIVQGERAMAVDNKSLGKFVLDNIEPASRGTPQIEVSFDINSDGILNVTAKDKKTNKTQSINIEATSHLEDSEIERMKKDAEINADKDKGKKEFIEVRNIAEQGLYEGENILKEQKDEEAKKELQDAIQKLKDAIGSGEKDTLQNQLKSSSEVFAKYKNLGSKKEEEKKEEEKKEEEKKEETKNNENDKDSTENK